MDNLENITYKTKNTSGDFDKVLEKLNLIAHLLADIRRNTRQATGVDCANNSAYQENRGEKSIKSTR